MRTDTVQIESVGCSSKQTIRDSYAKGERDIQVAELLTEGIQEAKKFKAFPMGFAYDQAHLVGLTHLSYMGYSDSVERQAHPAPIERLGFHPNPGSPNGPPQHQFDPLMQVDSLVLLNEVIRCHSIPQMPMMIQKPTCTSALILRRSQLHR